MNNYKKSNMKIELLPGKFVTDDGNFLGKEAQLFCGKIAGICYDKEGYNHLACENEDKTMKRVNKTMMSGHHSVYDHVMINLNIQNIPKILAMILNNEQYYTTSEKSARYTPIVREENSIITSSEEDLYNKWLNIFEQEIKCQYGLTLSNEKIVKLAQENARYLVTVFMPTQMVYSVTYRQINYLVSWMLKYSRKIGDSHFDIQLYTEMMAFVEQISALGLLEENLLNNEKNRSISLFGSELDKKEEIFSDVYQTVYIGSFAQLAQAQRHRTLNYQMSMDSDLGYFIPPILEDSPVLIQEWLNDMDSVKNVYPQGQLIRICESGCYDKFIEKCKERICSSAQLEIMRQTRSTLLKYKECLEEKEHVLASDIALYSKGARCTFPDYTCNSDCKFLEGKTLTRRI